MATASKTARLADKNEREAGSLEHWDVFMGDIKFSVFSVQFSAKAGSSALRRRLEICLSERLLECVVFVPIFDTNAALKRTGKKQKMRRTGHNRRRTGQRSKNGGENESGFFRQEDRIFRIDRNRLESI